MNDLFYQGTTAWFRQVDLDQLGDTYNLIPIESDLKELGFEVLGDFVCSAVPTVVNRAFVNLRERIQALIMVIVVEESLRVAGIFLGSILEDRTSVTTTATNALRDREVPGSCRKVVSWTNTNNLVNEHKIYLDKLRPVHGPPGPIGEDLRTLFIEIDVATLNESQNWPNHQ